jgi:hypothetical protein
MAPLPMIGLIEKVVRFPRPETVRPTGPAELVDLPNETVLGVVQDEAIWALAEARRTGRKFAIGMTPGD